MAPADIILERIMAAGVDITDRQEKSCIFPKMKAGV